MPSITKKFIHKAFFGGKGNLVSFHEPYQVIAELLRPHNVRRIIDAGASTGRISLRLLRAFPYATAYAFEPNPLYQEQLKKLAAANPRFRPQFHVLSDRAGSVTLNIAKSPGITSIFKPSRQLKRLCREDATILDAIQVDAVTIDDWAERSGVKSVEIMKFDIQGAELLALRGAVTTLRRSTLLIYTELLFNPLYEGGTLYSEIDLFLREAGFVLFDLYKPRYDERGKLLWANGIFVHAERMGL